MAVQTITYLFGKEIRRSPFAPSSKPLRVTVDLDDDELIANLGSVMIKPNTCDSVIATVELGIPPRPCSKVLTAAEINNLRLQADFLGIISTGLIYVPD